MGLEQDLKVPSVLRSTQGAFHVNFLKKKEIEKQGISIVDEKRKKKAKEEKG